MHAMTFQLKRAYWCSQLSMRSSFRDFGLTPARFDMLMALVQMEDRQQAYLRGALGVCATTVSVMLRALERTGLVRRWRDSRDGRRWMVGLTELGWAAYRAAYRVVVALGAGRRLVRRALGVTPEAMHPVARRMEMTLARMEGALFGQSISQPASAIEGEPPDDPLVEALWPGCDRDIAWADH